MSPAPPVISKRCGVPVVVTPPPCPGTPVSPWTSMNSQIAGKKLKLSSFHARYSVPVGVSEMAGTIDSTPGATALSEVLGVALALSSAALSTTR